jgi:hypothetical protein
MPSRRISLWLHERLQDYQSSHPDLSTGPDGWLEAKDRLERVVEEDFQLKKRRTRKAQAQFREDSKAASQKKQLAEAVGNATRPTLKLRSFPLETVVTVTKFSCWKGLEDSNILRVRCGEDDMRRSCKFKDDTFETWRVVAHRGAR